MRARLVPSTLSWRGLVAGLLVVAVLLVATSRSGGSDTVTAAAPGTATTAATTGANIDTDSNSTTGPDADTRADAAAPSAEDRAVAEYAEALRPLLRDGGQVVVDGLRPGVADIAQGAFDDEVLVRMAAGWVAALEDVAADVAALPTPAVLEDAAAGYDRALRTYVRVAELLLAAARAGGDERADLVEQAAELGPTADRQFDDADALLETTLDRHLHEPGDPADQRGTP